ncbi:MAG: D-tyrosyl-tRNA(Tyr) deacylase [Deltaproteobacteria bacterium]|jgi:D-tyrosyl-tRNA(Tyr) deacylase|nr:D-tyrosyl-tRNA(Tyr) deacylase [Deltaproteobacteria bacterium]MBK7067355.1 D-tyrosyl-tRNA(Tyr) deacylase [Deltaproteobacteria bacterium]MBP6834866.1 D-tyrosyl-tRNA(Tyr) deacylase [Deltaproteobacteria bacterium]
MRAVAQRVTEARVRVAGEVVGEISKGLVVFLGVGAGDDEAAAVFMADKIVGMRVFEDAAGKMSLDVSTVGGAVLLVSQFTLYGDMRRGRRPSFDRAMEPVTAEALYRRVGELIRARGVVVETGVFRAEMLVESVNEGPVTILVDSAREF